MHEKPGMKMPGFFLRLFPFSDKHVICSVKLQDVVHEDSGHHSCRRRGKKT